MKQQIMSLIDRLRPAFDELWIYPVALLGVLCAPVVVAATNNQPVTFAIDIGSFAIALVITAIVVMIAELRGTKEQKKVAQIRLWRYVLGFMFGLFWRLIVPLAGKAVVTIFSLLTA